ncbi:isoflavone reductase [Colletotrichum tabaci]|uniref:Isoflavone reductase n=1 Tax=Colletotrichum tabaci TaxID=1209068 RepID=A0AAV9SWU9_9PEZI
MASLKNILLIGAGGNLGLPVLEALLAIPSYKVRVLARKESTSVFPEGVPVFKADYSKQAEIQLAMEGQDVVICMVEPFATGNQNIFIDAAIAAGVKRFFPSEFGPPSRDPRFVDLKLHVVPAKAATVDYLRTKESQISWTSIVTGLFFDWAVKGGVLGLDPITKTARLVDGGTTVLTASNLPYIAKAVLACLDQAEQTKNQYVYIGEFHVSQTDVMAAFEKVQGQEWTTENLDSETIIAAGQKKLEDGDKSGVKDLIWGGTCGKRGLGDSRPWGLWDDKLGLEKASLEKVVSGILATW